jgi:hypothetical protein
MGVFQALPGWTALSGGRIELWNAHNGVVATDGADFAELDHAGALDGFHQDVRTTAGQSYTLTLTCAPAQRRDLDPRGGGGVERPGGGDHHAGRRPGLVQCPVTGTGGLDRLTIREVGGQAADGRGALLDNFSLVVASTPLARVSGIADGEGSKLSAATVQDADDFVFSARDSAAAASPGMRHGSTRAEQDTDVLSTFMSDLMAEVSKLRAWAGESVADNFPWEKVDEVAVGDVGSFLARVASLTSDDMLL